MWILALYLWICVFKLKYPIDGSTLVRGLGQGRGSSREGLCNVGNTKGMEWNASGTLLKGHGGGGGIQEKGCKRLVI